MLDFLPGSSTDCVTKRPCLAFACLGLDRLAFACLDLDRLAFACLCLGHCLTLALALAFAHSTFACQVNIACSKTGAQKNRFTQVL